MKYHLFAYCLCATAVASIAEAKPLGAFWEEVPIIDSPDDSSDLTGFRSFDLFVQLEQGDSVGAIVFGDSSNEGISLGTGQDFFQHNFGQDIAVDPGLYQFWPDLIYDSRFQMGITDFNDYTALLAPDWDTTGVNAGFAGIPTPPQNSRPTFPNEQGQYWLGRFTVTSSGGFGQDTSGLGEFLGGEVSFIDNNFLALVSVPNAFIPAPSAPALFGGALLILVRRQRID